MSYTNQTTTNLADLISKLNTFLSGTPGWTTHHVPASGEFAARKASGSVDIGFASQWDTASPNALGIYQFHGAAYNAGNSPWDQNDDSGNGAASTSDATLDNARHALLTNTPQQFWCFEDDDYFHCVVQSTDTKFVHFGAGNLTKMNDWTGGEYVYGHRQRPTATSNSALAGDSTFILDGLSADSSPITNMEEFVATLHLEGLNNMGASEMWGVIMGNQSSANLGQDRQAVAQDRVHCLGGYRAGLTSLLLGQFPGSTQRGLIPMYPIPVGYWDRSTSDVHWPLGFMPDVRGVINRNFAAGEEVVVGSDTWTIFPAGEKATADGGSNDNNTTTQCAGIAYRKVTT